MLHASPYPSSASRHCTEAYIARRSGGTFLAATEASLRLHFHPSRLDKPVISWVIRHRYHRGSIDSLASHSALTFVSAKSALTCMTHMGRKKSADTWI